MSIDVQEIAWDDVAQLKRDNDALRATLARVTAERDQWRNTAQDQAVRIAGMVQRIRALCKEVVS